MCGTDHLTYPTPDVLTYLSDSNPVQRRGFHFTPLTSPFPQTQMALILAMALVLALALALVQFTEGVFPWQGSPSSFRSKCLAYKPENSIVEATRTELAFIPAGTNLTLTDNDASCNRPSQVVDTDLCRVSLHIPTSTRSGIVYELWLPETWNGRLVTTGNGGIDGCKLLIEDCL